MVEKPYHATIPLSVEYGDIVAISWHTFSAGPAENSATRELFVPPFLVVLRAFGHKKNSFLWLATGSLFLGIDSSGGIIPL